MRAYRASSEESVRARDLLKDWAGEGLLTEVQYQRMEKETVCDLRQVNLFLRFVLFLFTLLIAIAGFWLFQVVFLPHAGQQTMGLFLLICAAISYAAAEFAVLRFQLYRYGIEEALAVCSVGFLCVGLQAALFSGRTDSPRPAGMECLVPAAGAVVSFWIWRRFGLPYAPLAAMIFVVWLADCWTSSQMAQHLIVAAFYAACLIAVAAVRLRHRFTYRNEEYSILEALLWLGIYLAINLQLSPVDLLRQGWVGSRSSGEFPRAFYWTTWVLTWCLSPAILARGFLRKDRPVIAVGMIAAILTAITNKPYLGWPRHTWDPMLLGALLIGVALLIRRRLNGGPGIRQVFTARRLSANDKHWMDAGSAAFGLLSPHAVTPSPQTASPEVRFGGGDSGGGGANSDF